MKRFDQYLKDAGYYSINKVIPEYKYFAYKAGKCEETTDPRVARNFSTLVETVQVNKEKVEKFHQDLIDIENEAVKAWRKDLFAQYPQLSVEVLNVCYAHAYEKGHADGYDDISTCMNDTVEFTEKILRVL